MEIVYSLILLNDTAVDAHDNHEPTWWVADGDEQSIGNAEISEVLRLSERVIMYSQGDANLNIE